MTKVLTTGLVAAPLLYYFALFAGAATYPGYDHLTRYASELGAADAPYPQLFNYSIIGMGVASVLGALGMALNFTKLSDRWFWPAAAGVALALWGASMILGGMYPMPDERHGAFGIGLVQPLVPLLALLALWNVPQSAGVRVFLAFIFFGSIAMLAIMMGAGQLVRVENVGAWQRAYTAFAIPWTLVLGLWLILRKPS